MLDDYVPKTYSELSVKEKKNDPKKGQEKGALNGVVEEGYDEADDLVNFRDKQWVQRELKGIKPNLFVLTEKGVMVSKRLDVMQALRRFANKKNLLTVHALFGSKLPLTLSQLRSKTGLGTNDLNHSLSALRDVDVVLKLENKYTLTIYGEILIQAIDDIYNKINLTLKKSDIYSEMGSTSKTFKRGEKTPLKFTIDSVCNYRSPASYP